MRTYTQVQEYVTNHGYTLEKRTKGYGLWLSIVNVLYLRSTLDEIVDLVKSGDMLNSFSLSCRIPQPEDFTLLREVANSKGLELDICYKFKGYDLEFSTLQQVETFLSEYP
jgi:hypothetical protein